MGTNQVRDFISTNFMDKTYDETYDANDDFTRHTSLSSRFGRSSNVERSSTSTKSSSIVSFDQEMDTDTGRRTDTLSCSVPSTKIGCKKYRKLRKKLRKTHTVVNYNLKMSQSVEAEIYDSNNNIINRRRTSSMSKRVNSVFEENHDSKKFLRGTSAQCEKTVVLAK